MRFPKQTFGLTVLFGLLVSGAVVPLSAQAQQPAAAQGLTKYPDCPAGKVISDADTKEAHAKYIAGYQDYKDKAYDRAIARFLQAYEYDCTKHDILVIISSAFEKKGAFVEATRALNLYLERVPDSPEAKSYHAKIESLVSLATPPAASGTATAAPTTSAAPSASSSGSAQPAQPGSDTALSPFPFILGGVGVAALVTGLVVLVASPTKPDNCDVKTEICTQPKTGPTRDLDADRSQAAASKNQPLYGIGILGGGVAMVAGAGVWLYLDAKSSKTSAMPKLTPSVAPGYAGMSLGGRF